LLLQFITVLLDTCTYTRIVNNLCILIQIQATLSELFALEQLWLVYHYLSAGNEPTIKCCSA